MAMGSRGEMAHRAVKAALAIGGGAGAGYLDGHYAGKTFAGQSYGTVAAAGALAVGLLGLGGKYSVYAREIGAGAAAGIAYKMANKKSSSDGAVHGVRGVAGSLPTAARVITPQEVARIYHSIGVRA